VDIVFRSVALFLFVYVVMRVSGRRELSSLTAIDLVLIIVVGDLIQQGVTQEDTSVTGAMLAVGTIGVWILLFSWLSYRFRPMRKVIEGVPVVVVRDGRPVDAALKLERVTLEEVLESARNQGIGNLRDISVAILEPSGQFSFLKRTSDNEQQGAPEKHKA